MYGRFLHRASTAVRETTRARLVSGRGERRCLPAIRIASRAMALAAGHGTSVSARSVFRFGDARQVVFSSDFDSGNLSRVQVHDDAQETYNVWTVRDNEGGSREGKCDSWFYFSVKGIPAGDVFRINLMNFKQKKLFSQGWVPVFKTTHEPNKVFGRLKERPRTWTSEEEGCTVLSFEFKVASANQTTWFAFSCPYSYQSCQTRLANLDSLYGMSDLPVSSTSSLHSLDGKSRRIPASLYYHREPLVTTGCGRQVDLITLSSTKGMSCEEEVRLPGLFPDPAVKRAARFNNKKVVLISARVHPGEAPSSHVFNGLLDLLLSEDDRRAQVLRDRFVFKLIPILNPDGVSQGHFRSDTRGVNLNRVYIRPHYYAHPSIYAVRQVLLYHHSLGHHTSACPLSAMSREELIESFTSLRPQDTRDEPVAYDDRQRESAWPGELNADPELPRCECDTAVPIHRPHGLVLYVDLHAHANKQGCFMFGNYFEDSAKQTACELFPKLCSMNSPFFEFGQCSFSQSGMLGKEGSGRVAMYRATNLVHCYTLECHYASGRCAGHVPSVLVSSGGRTSPVLKSSLSPLYESKHFQQVGHALGVSILDLLGENPCPRLGQLSPPTTLHNVKANLEERIIRERRQIAERGGKKRGTHSLPKPRPVVRMNRPWTAKQNVQQPTFRRRQPAVAGPTQAAAQVSLSRLHAHTAKSHATEEVAHQARASSILATTSAASMQSAASASPTSSRSSVQLNPPGSGGQVALKVRLQHSMRGQLTNSNPSLSVRTYRHNMPRNEAILHRAQETPQTPRRVLPEVSPPNSLTQLPAASAPRQTKVPTRRASYRAPCQPTVPLNSAGLLDILPAVSSASKYGRGRRIRTSVRDNNLQYPRRK